jgi:SAM-dependent methyltransferase
MRRLLYRVMYWLGRTPWESGVTPPEVTAAFDSGEIPPGPCLDLGCGTGTNAIYMARRGRLVTGVDFVPKAIAAARDKARQAGVAIRTQFYVADVSRLPELSLPRCAFALDIGCFHGLTPEAQRRYADGLAATLLPGARYMLYTLDPRRQAAIVFGVLPEQVVSAFTPFFVLLRSERGNFRTQGSTWFWMERRG